jgi:uncharacterized protein (DUF58 family)
MNQKSNLILLIIIALFLGALISQNGALALMALPFLVYLGVGLITSQDEVNLTGTRTVNPARCSGEEPISMRLTIENQGQMVPRLRVVEPLRGKMTWIAGNTSQSACLPPGESLAFDYTFNALRGCYTWDHIDVRSGDAFGLFEKRLQVPAEARLLVLPAQSSTLQLKLRPRHTIRVPGPNLSGLAGSGVDFWGVRNYALGDSLRWIDWHRVARHPGQLFSKEFEREEMADIGLMLDARAVTNLKYGDDSLFEYSIEAAASLARLYIRAGNRVSLFVFGGGMNYVFPGSGRGQLARILDQLAASDSHGEETINTLRYIPVRLFPSRSVLILISPFQQKDLESLIRLRSEGYQVILLALDAVQFAASHAANTAATPHAVRAARLERAALLWQVRQLGVQVVDWQVDQPLFRINGREGRR